MIGHNRVLIVDHVNGRLRTRVQGLSLQDWEAVGYFQRYPGVKERLVFSVLGGDKSRHHYDVPVWYRPDRLGPSAERAGGKLVAVISIQFAEQELRARLWDPLQQLLLL